MGLANSRMSTVLQISSRVFGRRIEREYKESQAASCLPDMNTALGTLTDIVIELRGERFAKDAADRSVLVLELGVRCNLNGVVMNTTGEAWLVVEAESEGGSLNIELSLEYDRFILISPIPIPPDVQTALDAFIRSRLEPILAANEIPVNLQSVFASTMSIFEDPELTIVGGSNDSSPTLAIGLEIAIASQPRDNTIDRDHFTNDYAENLIQPAFGSDWALQIDSALMEVKMQEEFDGRDLGNIIPNWTRTDLRKAYWSGNGLDWDYKGWQDYVNSHFHEHPVWLACKGVCTVRIRYIVIGWEDWHPTIEERYKDVDVGIYWFAHADLGVEGDSIVMDPYIFELGFRNSLLSTTLPEISYDIDPIPIGPARFGDLVITQLQFTTDDLIAYGVDQHEGLSGSPRIEAPSDLAVNFLITPFLSRYKNMICTFFANKGELEGDSVISHFEICNTGDAPLWICSLTLENDVDGVFTLRTPASSPFMLAPGGCIASDVLLTVPEDDHQPHQCTISIRCNDFNQPEVSIPVHGVKQTDVEPGAGSCFEIPGVVVSEDGLDRIIDLIYGYVKERFPEHEDLFPSAPEPDPLPCPICGYYMDVVISGLPPDASIDVLGPSNKPIESSKVFGNCHFFSVPLGLTKRPQYRLSPEKIEGKCIIKPTISRITRAGMFKTKEKIISISVDREFVFLLHKNEIDIISISTPKRPRIVNQIKIEDCLSIRAINGYVYAQTNKTIEIFDISDPYAPDPARRTIVTEPDSALLIGKNRLTIIDSKKVRSYEILNGFRQRLIQELRIQDAIKKHPGMRNAYHLATDKGVLLLKGRPKQEEEFVPQDDYLLRILDDKKGFEVLQKDMLPYIFKRKEVEELTSKKGLKKRPG